MSINNAIEAIEECLACIKCRESENPLDYSTLASTSLIEELLQRHRPLSCLGRGRRVVEEAFSGAGGLFGDDDE